MRTHRLALGTVAAGHLAVAGVTAYAGVAIVSTVVLALVGVLALVLAVAGPPDAADRRRPRRDRYRMGRLQATGRSVDTEH